ncbi:MAG: MMPL family transporter, partial [Actinomycetes bacterium]
MRFGGEYKDSFDLPNTESATAQDMLSQLSGGAGTGSGLDGQVVRKSSSGQAVKDSTATTMTTLLTKVSDLPGVTCVVTPFGAPLGSQCPQQPANQGGDQGQRGQTPAPPPSEAAAGALAHFGEAGVSPDGGVAYATVSFAGASIDDLKSADVLAALDVVFVPVIASMIGLGVGIDYSLFVINRCREAIVHGHHRAAGALRHADQPLQRYRHIGGPHRVHGDG